MYSDILKEGKEDDDDPNRIPSSPDLRSIHVFIQPAKANGLFYFFLNSFIEMKNNFCRTSCR